MTTTTLNPSRIIERIAEIRSEIESIKGRRIKISEDLVLTKLAEDKSATQNLQSEYDRLTQKWDALESELEVLQRRKDSVEAEYRAIIAVNRRNRYPGLVEEFKVEAANLEDIVQHIQSVASELVYSAQAFQRQHDQVASLASQVDSLLHEFPDLERISTTVPSWSTIILQKNVTVEEAMKSLTYHTNKNATRKFRPLHTLHSIISRLEGK